MRAALILAAAVLAGCANPPIDNRSPEQIKASAADRSIKVQCILATTPWGPQRTVVFEYDRQSVLSGKIFASPDCGIEMTADPKPIPQPKPAGSQP